MPAPPQTCLACPVRPSTSLPTWSLIAWPRARRRRFGVSNPPQSLKRGPIAWPRPCALYAWPTYPRQNVQTWSDIVQSADYQAWAQKPPSQNLARLRRTIAAIRLERIERLARAAPADSRLPAKVQVDSLDQVRQDARPFSVGDERGLKLAEFTQGHQ